MAATDFSQFITQALAWCNPTKKAILIYSYFEEH